MQPYYEHYIRPYHTSDGRVDLDIAQHAVETELGVASISADQIYQPARISAHEASVGSMLGTRGFGGRACRYEESTRDHT
jgi:hypothetical protein